VNQDFIYQQTVQLPTSRMVDGPGRERPMVHAKKSWSQLYGVQAAFTLSTPFQKDKYLILPMKPDIFGNKFLNFVYIHARGNFLFMQAMQNLISVGSPEHFMSRIPSELLRINHALRVSLLQIFPFRFYHTVFEGTFLKLARRASSRNREHFKRNLTKDLASEVISLNGKIGLDRCI
jgi:hypothetical protein